MKKSILNNSVVLGIFLSERIEERKKVKEAALLLSKIKLEINENKKLLEHWVPYHKEVVHRLDSLNTNELFIKNFQRGTHQRKFNG